MYKILIADDEPSIRSGLSQLNWNSLGIEVVASVSNGLEAYNFIAENDVDIILTDIKMPVMDGLELINRIRKLPNKDIVVVALSGYSQFDYVKHCLKNNVSDYLLKPLDIDEWNATFSNIINRLNSSSSANGIILKSGSKNHLVNSAIEYMEQHFCDQITLTDVANHIYANPTYLSRVIKEETGVGFIELLTKLRIEAAKKMLKDPTYKINEIAEKVGYINPRYFTHTFKKYTGRTPYSYRSE